MKSDLLLRPMLLTKVQTSTDELHCQSFSTRLSLPNVTVHETRYVSAGTNLTFPHENPSCRIKSQIVSTDVCQVSLTAITGLQSQVRYQIWLPFQWNGRFLGVGNGGLSGCVKYNDINYGASHGFATIGSNNGHDGGSSGLPFYNNPGVIQDYVSRAVHTEAILGKTISEQFYEARPHKSYYLGCSTGGRQGFKEAQEFPEDFDGVVAGAPAFDLNALMYWTGQFYLKTGGPESPNFISAAQWELVFQDVLKQCDGLDGVLDGVIEDTDLCNYRPEALICSAKTDDKCLTGAQAKIVRTVFEPVHVDGALVYPRLQPGAKSAQRYLAGKPHSFPIDWFRYAVYNNPEWDIEKLSSKDWEAVRSKNPGNAATWEGDLSRARNRGVKILHFHGLEDEVISSDNSARYYNHVSQTMGLSYSELDEFYRYFRISGMAHCRGGNGASFIGANEETFANFDPASNVLAAIVDWVENGRAPETVLGTKYAGGSRRSGRILAQRRHCRYPRRNVYHGYGDAALPDSWQCTDI
ncbi:tannase [Fusarium torreyae]|uniref:Carboxylic ester hydrolase n=1 Tax=Fusarium torreyae TaxID=1237075 RepID=A0A9W8VG49_9HYPO|nr:tannase [Fusarium torreyae]